MFEKYDAVIFDVDGTLVDLMHQHAQSYQRVFERVLGIRIPNPAFFLRLFNRGSEKAVFEAALRKNHVAPTPELIQRLIAARSGEFAKATRSVTPAAIITGVKQTLSNLSRAGKKVYCVSGNNRQKSLGSLRRTGLLPLVNDAHFLMDEPKLTSKEALIEFMIQKHGLSKLQVCFVGDTPADIAAGKKVGIDVIAVATGVVSASQLRKARYGRVVKRLAFRNPVQIRSTTKTGRFRRR